MAQASLERGETFPHFPLRAVPFNRLETSNWELLANLSCAWRPEVMDDLRDAIRQATGREHVFFASSGRGAIAQILAMLPHEEVVLPAYTCAVMRPAAELGRKRIVYVDVAKNKTGAHTKEAIPFRDLAFALAHNILTYPWLYGRFTLPRVLRKSAALASQTKWENPEILAATPHYSRAFHPYQAGLVLRMLPRLDAIRSHIGRIVSAYGNVFRGTPIQTFSTSDTDDGGLLRFPVAFPGKERSQVLRLALQRGVYLDIDYFDRALPDPSEHTLFPNAVWAARNVALLPLYTSLSPSSAETLAQQVVAAKREAPFVYAQ